MIRHKIIGEKDKRLFGWIDVRGHAINPPGIHPIRVGNSGLDSQKTELKHKSNRYPNNGNY